LRFNRLKLIKIKTAFLFVLALGFLGHAPISASETAMDGCSAFAAVGKWTTTGRAILMQNRDLEWPNAGQLVTRVQGNGFSFITETTAPYGGIGQRINERGLAMVGTDVDTVAQAGQLSSTKISDAVMHQAANLEQAYTIMTNLISSQGSKGGHTLIIANSTAIMGVEAAGRRVARTDILKDGVIIQTNHFNILTELNGPVTQCSRLRYDRVSQLVRANQGTLNASTVVDLIARDTMALDGFCSVNAAWSRDSGGTTASGVLEPASDSTSVMWVALGHPTSAIYIPVFSNGPIPPEVESGRLHMMSENLRLRRSDYLSQFMIVENALFAMTESLPPDASFEMLEQISMAARNMVLGKYIELGAPRSPNEEVLTIVSISNATHVDGIAYLFPSGRISIALGVGEHRVETPQQIPVYMGSLTFQAWSDGTATSVRSVLLVSDTTLEALYLLARVSVTTIAQTTPTTRSVQTSTNALPVSTPCTITMVVGAVGVVAILAVVLMRRKKSYQKSV